MVFFLFYFFHFVFGPSISLLTAELGPETLLLFFHMLLLLVLVDALAIVRLRISHHRLVAGHVIVHVPAHA